MNHIRKSVFGNFGKTLIQSNKYGLYIHEYQAYEILKKYGLPMVPVSRFSYYRASELPLQKMLMQLHKG